MSVKIATRHTNGVVILDANEKVTLGEGTSTLRKKIRELVESGATKIVLNMADVTYMDSSGLGELLASHTTVTSAGGEVKLLHVSPRVRKILELTRIDTIFEIFEDDDLAIDSFSVAAGIVDHEGGTNATAGILLWALQIVTAAVFFQAAFAKLTGSPAMVGLFEKVGMGQWFRYFTGACEALGGLLLLIPGLAGVGAMLLVAVMLGAIVMHVAKIGGSPAHALTYLALAALVAWFRRRG